MSNSSELFNLQPKVKFGLQLLFSGLILLGLIWLLTASDLGLFGSIDLIEYHSAAKLIWQNRNPYSLAELSQIQKQIASLPEVIRIWNPPLVLPLIFWMEFFSFKLLIVLWLIFSSAIFICSFKLSLADSQTKKFWPLFFAFTFYPLALLLYYGQISAISLLGLALFLHLVRDEGKQQPNSNFFAGLALSLTLIKPHLLYLLYLYLLIGAFKTRKHQVLIGFLTGAGALILFSIILAPPVWSWYFAALAEPPIYFKTPTLGNWLQELTAVNQPWVRGLPTYLGVVLATAYFLKTRHQTTNFFWIIPLSLVSAPYGWVYDYLLLLPVALWLLAQQIDSVSKNYVTGLLLCANLVLTFSPSGTGQQWYFWYPLIYLFCFWLVQQNNKQNN